MDTALNGHAEAIHQRIEGVEKDLESTKKRLHGHVEATAKTQGEMVRVLQEIRMDVHGLRVQKRLIVAIILFALPALWWATRWSMTDVLIAHGVVKIVRSDTP